MQRISFPEVIDSTIIGTFRSCPQKFFRMYGEHWKPQFESVDLHAGAAFARGVEVTRREFYDNGKRPEDAVALGLQALMLAYGNFEPPEDSPKSLDRMCGAFEFYWDQYPLSFEEGAIPIELPGGKRAIEFSFAEPLEFRHPETGNPIIYSGRADAICSFAGGIYVTDEKTTKSLGARWASQWDLRSQFTGYCWAANLNSHIETVTGVLVRGVSILKTKFDTAVSITNRSKWEIERWYEQVHHDLQRMQLAWETGWWDFNLDHACTEYGGCPLTRVCKSNDPETWLPMYFEKRIWNPLERTETKVEG